MQLNEELTCLEADKLAVFVDTFSTVSLHPAVVGQIVAEIAIKVNQHSHTKTCRKYHTICRFKMPKLPSYKTIIARPPIGGMSNEEKTCLQEKHDTVINMVKKVLEDKEAIQSILEEFPKEKEKDESEAKKGRKKRIDAVLEKAGLKSKEDQEKYYRALAFSSTGGAQRKH